jgi:hypothetical protein
MDTVFKKLNYKEQKEICVINSPKTFNVNLDSIKNISRIIKNIDKVRQTEFILVFVTKQNEINELVPKIADKLDGDGTLWFAYPKGTSKNYKCDFNRDTGWYTLGEYGFEGVRQVAIDEDWSALRFRRVEYIKKMTRSKNLAISKDGKNKTSGK